MPGADAMNRLKTLDAKIKSTRDGMKEHMAKEKKVRKGQCRYASVDEGIYVSVLSHPCHASQGLLCCVW